MHHRRRIDHFSGIKLHFLKRVHCTDKRANMVYSGFPPAKPHLRLRSFSSNPLAVLIFSTAERKQRKHCTMWHNMQIASQMSGEHKGEPNSLPKSSPQKSRFFCHIRLVSWRRDKARRLVYLRWQKWPTFFELAFHAFVLHYDYL